MLKRVLTGTILGLVLFVLGSLKMNQVLERQANQYQGLIDLFFPLEEKIAEMHLLLLEQQSLVETATAGDGRPASELREASERFDDALSACFEVCFALLEQPGSDLALTTEELRARLLSIHRAFADQSRQLADFFDRIAGGDEEEPRDPDLDRIAAQIAAHATSLQESVARFEEMLGDRYDAALMRAADARASVRRLFVGMVGAAVLLGILANIFFYRSLVPLKSMVDAVRDVGRGRYEVRLPAGGGSEVAFLAGEFNAMAQALGDQRRALERSQRFLRQSEKLSAIGELSLGVAHEVRNPLSTIQMTLNALGNREDLSRGDRERLALALHEVDRLEGLVSSLLEYGRPSEPHKAAADVTALIERSIDLVEAECERRGVGVDVEAIEPGLPAIEVDRDQVIQVLVNLLLNAVQASPEGARVRAGAALETGRRTGDMVAIYVADDGAGIDREELRRIFTPFFTTRRDGTGLGLPVARKIAEAHSGELIVDSTPGRGTTAVLKLPVQPIGPQPD